MEKILIQLYKRRPFSHVHPNIASWPDLLVNKLIVGIDNVKINLEI